MKLQLPAKQREFQVYNGTKGTWQSDNLSYLLKLAREGRRVAGTPPEAPASKIIIPVIHYRYIINNNEN
jgi:hypothetical protein